MEVVRSRRSILVGGTALAVTLFARSRGTVRADTLSEVTVYKSPT
jgi:hypothetical protein